MANNNTLLQKLTSANETTWMRLGALSELIHDPEKAMYSYENALRHNPYNTKALSQLAAVCRLREQYPKAVEYFQRILNIENSNGETWGALGHCYLMMDDLQKAYTAYQQALYHLPNPKDPNLWYGIGILYDRYGSYEHAEEAFTAVLKMDAKFEKANEIYFRLGIIYKQQGKYEQALDCFKYILPKPPRPLTQGDIWFQVGHVYELEKDFNNAKEAYERVLKETSNHAKSLQQLGWLYHSNATMGNQEIAINYLMRSIDADPSDGQTWYLLGRCYMAQQQYRKAYDAYQQAVYRDGRNPTFWCSIGVLYYQINQYRDALDAYSRAIRLNPYLSEVWYDLGTLYESCNQIQDSLDAYQRAAELDPGNKHIQQRLSALRAAQNNPKGTEIDTKEFKENNHEHEKTPMTLEPRATHVGGEPSRSPRMVPQNIPSVPDLVDLSSENDKRTLPSSNDIRMREMKSGAADKKRLDQPASPIEDARDRVETVRVEEDNHQGRPAKLIDPSERSKSFESNDKQPQKPVEPVSEKAVNLPKEGENSSPRNHTHNPEMTSEDSPKEKASSSTLTSSSASVNALINHSNSPPPSASAPSMPANTNGSQEHITNKAESPSASESEKKENGKQSPALKEVEQQPKQDEAPLNSKIHEREEASEEGELSDRQEKKQKLDK